MARHADGGRPACSPANPTLLAAFLTSKASPSVQNYDLGMDIAKIEISDSAKVQSEFFWAIDPISGVFGSEKI